MTAQTFRAQHSFVVNPSAPLRMERPAVDEAPMTDPTLLKMQGRRRKRGSGLMVAIPAAILVTAVGGAGLWALTRPHTSAVTTPSPIVAAAASNAQGAADRANSAAGSAQNDAATARMASANATEDKVAKDRADRAQLAAAEAAPPARASTHQRTAAVRRHSVAAASGAGADASATAATPAMAPPLSRAPATVLPAPQIVTAPMPAMPMTPEVMTTPAPNPAASTTTQP
jgi:hypothetical protein